MELPLTPLDFLRRARKLYGAREALVDGALRLTYAEFGERCDQWSAALQRLGVRQGDRVGTIAPNTHQHLEQFYAVPQIGAVIVPMNYRLTADDFVYLANHSGCKVLCVHADYLESVDGVRSRMPNVQPLRRARRRASAGWLEYETLLAESERRIRSPGHRRVRSHRHQLHERHHRAAEGRDDHAPQRVDQQRGHDGALAHDAGGPLSLDTADVSRERLDVHVDRHRRGRHACLPAQGRREHSIYEHIKREQITRLCAAPTVLIAIANGPEAERRQRAPRRAPAHRGRTARRRHHRTHRR